MIFNLAQFFDATQIPCDYSIIVLNQKIICKHFDMLFKRASLRICADGGYDQLRNWIGHERVAFNDYAPDYIIGDLDSINNDIAEKTKIVRIADQDRNDLQKCIDFVLSPDKCQNKTFVIVGALGGRFDHELQALSSLYQYLGHTIIYLNEQSVVTLFGPGTIEINVDSPALGPHCGFGPFRDRCVVSTTGFKWNLNQSGSHKTLSTMFPIISRIGAWLPSQFIQYCGILKINYRLQQSDPVHGGSKIVRSHTFICESYRIHHLSLFVFKTSTTPMSLSCQHINLIRRGQPLKTINGFSSSELLQGGRGWN